MDLTNIPGLNPSDIVVIKKYSYGDKCKLASKVANISISKGMRMNQKQIEQELENKIDLWAMQIYPLVYGIETAPFLRPGMTETDKIQAVEHLPGETGAYLLEKVNELNNGQEIGIEEQKK
jgi:signal peptidase I